MTTSALDTALPMEDVDLNLLDKIDEVVRQAEESNSPQILFQYGMAMRKMSQASGLALAKLLYEGARVWSAFSSDDDWPTVVQTQMGISGQTYNKYYRVWKYVINHPHLLADAYLQAQIMKKPINGLIRLIAAAREDQITPGDWEEIAKAPDVKTISDIRARIRGHKGPAKSALRLWLLKDGTLKVRIGDGDYQNKGYIARDDTRESDMLISRLESVGVVVEPIE